MAGRIPNVLERLVVPTGDKVFADGEPGECAYVVQDGLIEIVKGFPGEEVVLGTIEKGGIFGEMALIDDQPRMASARAVMPSTLIVITRPAFQKKISKCDPFVKGLLGIFVKNIRRMVDEKLGD
jgi:CRP-like cAMP-binding protein